MSPSPSSPPTQIVYRSVTEAAIALALGGSFSHQSVEGRMLVFHITPPPGLDLNDPNLMAPVASILAWTETLATRVRAHQRALRGSPR